MPRQILKAENAHVLGGGNGTPCVVIDRLKSETTVWIANAPWGWGACEVSYIGEQRNEAAKRKAAKFKLRIEYAAARENERRARIKAGGGGL